MVTIEHLILKTKGGNLNITEIENNKYALTINDFPVSREILVSRACFDRLEDVWSNLTTKHKSWFYSTPLYISPQLIDIVQANVRELLTGDTEFYEGFDEILLRWQNWFEIDLESTSYSFTKKHNE